MLHSNVACAGPLTEGCKLRSSPELLRGERLDEGEDGVVDAGQQLQEHPVREAQAGG